MQNNNNVLPSGLQIVHNDSLPEIPIGVAYPPGIPGLHRPQNIYLANNTLSQSDLEKANYLKHEKNIMLVLDEICSQVAPYQSLKDAKSVDLIKVSDNLEPCNLSVKQTQRCWEKFRKSLREFQRRESEYVSLTRNEVLSNVCSEADSSFKSRLAVYDKHLDKAVEL